MLIISAKELRMFPFWQPQLRECEKGLDRLWSTGGNCEGMDSVLKDFLFGKTCKQGITSSTACLFSFSRSPG